MKQVNATELHAARGIVYGMIPALMFWAVIILLVR